MNKPKFKDQFNGISLAIWAIGFIAISLYIWFSDIIPIISIKLIFIAIAFVSFMFKALQLHSMFHFFDRARYIDSQKHK